MLKEFKTHRYHFGVILDEYGATIGIITLNDIFREIFEEIEIRKSPIKKIDYRTFLVDGQVAVEDLNTQLNLNLPEKKDYTTISGLVIYHFGKFPRPDSSISIANVRIHIKSMGDRKIEKLLLVKDET